MEARFKQYCALEKRGVSCCLTAKSFDFYKVWDYFDSLGTGRQEAVTLDLYTDFWGDSSELSVFGPEFEKMLDKVFANLYLAVRDKDMGAREFRQYWPWMKTLHKRTTGYGGCLCGADEIMVHTDLQGNLYDCHAYDVPYTTIRESGIVGGRNLYKITDACRSCEVFQYCMGGCIAVDPKAKEKHCYLLRQQLSRLVAVLELCGGRYVKADQ